MSILIKGMEMPNDGRPRKALFTLKDGAPVVIVETAKSYDDKNIDVHPLVPVPPHGDLIDLKSPFKAQYYDEMTEEWAERMVTVEDALYGCMVDEMPPTIIPAEEVKTE